MKKPSLIRRLAAAAIAAFAASAPGSEAAAQMAAVRASAPPAAAPAVFGAAPGTPLSAAGELSPGLLLLPEAALPAGLAASFAPAPAPALLPSASLGEPVFRAPQPILPEAASNPTSRPAGPADDAPLTAPEAEPSPAVRSAYQALDRIQNGPLAEVLKPSHSSLSSPGAAVGQVYDNAFSRAEGSLNPVVTGESGSPGLSGLKPFPAPGLREAAPLAAAAPILALTQIDPQLITGLASRAGWVALGLLALFTALRASGALWRAGAALLKKPAPAPRGELSSSLLPWWSGSLLLASLTGALFWAGEWAFDWAWAVPSAATLLLWAAFSHVDRRRLDFRTAAEDYGLYHRNPVNKALHKLGIPLILFSIIHWTQTAGLTVGSLAIPAWFPWAAVFLPLYALWNWRLAAVMAAVVAAMAYVSTLPFMGPAWVAWAIFALGWVFQLIGHWFEGKSPAFTKNALQLLVGPLWILDDIGRALGLSGRSKPKTP